MMRRCVQILAVCSVSFVACSGGGNGGGSPSAPTPAATRVIALGGNLAFGNGDVGRTATATLTISNSGNATLTVSGVTVPPGFTVNFQSGTIAAGASQNVTVTFAPTAVGNYSGTITVLADHTSGTNTINVSGTGVSVNRAPIITGIIINPAFGISQLTPFSMTAAATDPDNDPLSYTWDFGDGTQGSGSIVSKTYGTGGNMTVRLSVNDGKAIQDVATATTSDTRSIAVGSMTGAWRLTTTACAGWGNQTFTLVLTQSSGRVTGSFSMPNGFCAAPNGSTGVTDPAEPGTIDANGAVAIRLKVGVYLDFYFRGTMQSPGNRVTGGLFNSGFGGDATTLDRQ
jgi:hypothetical protein